MGLRLGAIAGVAIALTCSRAAEGMVFRLHARPLDPLPDWNEQHPDLASKPEALALPPWLDWATRLLDGRAFTLLQPSWEGDLAPSVPWHLQLDAGLKGRADLGFGPTVVASGHMQWAACLLDGQLTGVLSSMGLAYLAEMHLGVANVGLNVRSWSGPNVSSAGRSATLTLSQPF